MTTEAKAHALVGDAAVDSDFGSEDDQRDMLRMGKAQELRVRSTHQAVRLLRMLT